MSNHNPSSSSPTVARSNRSMSKTKGVVRGRALLASAVPDSTDDCPPTKRARTSKIANQTVRVRRVFCEANSFSSLVLCTSATCHQDPRGHAGSDPNARGDAQDSRCTTPAQEIACLRRSTSLLEAYFFPNRRVTLPQRRVRDADPLVVTKKEVVDIDVSSEQGTSPPGILSVHIQGGLYIGPTSAATHLTINEGHDDESDDRRHSQDRASNDFAQVTQDYDRDLLSLLPSFEIIDSLIGYYFEHCNWIYRHVNQPSFTHQWERYKNGAKADRVVLATACALMAITTHYLPSQHALLNNFSSESNEEIGLRFFDVSTTSLQKHNAESQSYTLELVELLLVWAHFHTLSKIDSEEIWHVRGELVTVGTAMGLHRDPGNWRMQRDIAERRRWAWWHIVLLDRWQAFLFGRPLCIASHHFDTLLPSYCDPALDKTGRLYLPNIALFRLAFILGDIMDDAVSICPVAYESVQTNDRSLTQWMESLPSELDMDKFSLARSLASPDVATRRLGVQSVIIRTSYYHIRFTLHRPYASPCNNISTGKSSKSLEIAVKAADKLITMVGRSRPDTLPNSSIAVSGHLNWQPFHCFSATIFFSFQLIANPDQPGAELLRAIIQKAITTLEHATGIAVADKALDILQALSPLYSADFRQESPEAREEKRLEVLRAVRKLPFPYHDSHNPRRFGDSSGTRSVMSLPADSNSVLTPVPVLPALAALPQQCHGQTHNSLFMGNTAATLYRRHTHGLPQAHPHRAHSPETLPQSAIPPTQTLVPTPTYQTYNMSYQSQPIHNPNGYSYVQPVDDGSMWAAAVGFANPEWSHFQDDMQADG